MEKLILGVLVIKQVKNIKKCEEIII